jgi:aspartate/methionine/tyrosine aminotransferase
MRIKPVMLEDWLRQRYFAAEVDISSSGIAPYTFGELTRLCGLDLQELQDSELGDNDTKGSVSLREKIAERYLVSLEDVMVTSGSNEALFLLTTVLADPGDSLIAVAPRYEQMLGLSTMRGVEVRDWLIPMDPKQPADLNELEYLIDSTTKAIVVNFPHNPSGRDMGSREERALIDIADKHGLWILWDGAFRDLRYEGSHSYGNLVQYERSLVTGTLSKAYGAPGLRVGWCVASRTLMAELVQLRDYLALYVAGVLDFLAQRVLASAATLIGPRKEQLVVNERIVGDWARQNGLTWSAPGGGACGLLGTAGLDSLAFSQELYDRFGTLVIPGDAFNTPGTVRLGYGVPESRLVDGCERIHNCMKAMNS